MLDQDEVKRSLDSETFSQCTSLSGQLFIKTLSDLVSPFYDI